MMGEQVNKKVPAIRFKGFSENWEKTTLGGLGRVVMNKRIYKDQTAAKGDVPFYKIGTFGGEPDSYISRELFEEYKSKYPYPNAGDLLISASGSIGRVVEYQGEDEYFQDSNIVWLEHNGAVDNLFLKQFYSIVKWAGLEGSTIKRLYNSNILGTSITLPQKSEQQKIGNFFQQLDTELSLHQTKLDKLNTLKQAMLQKMFPQGNATEPEIRFKGFSGGWIKNNLGSICEIVGGGTPSTAISSYWNGDIDWYSPTEIGKKIYADGSVKKITASGFENSSTRMLPANRTILFTSRAGIGDMAILRRTGCTNQGFQSLLLNNETDPYFIYSMGYLIKDYAMKHASGSTFLEISSKQLSKMPLHIPSEEEQQKIGAYFRKLDELIALEHTQLDKLKQIKQACLAGMFV